MAAGLEHFQPALHMPLRQLAICMDCDECFDFMIGACPACGSTVWASLARFLGGHVSDVASRSPLYATLSTAK